MNELGWSDRIGELVRESMQSDTYERYYATKLTTARAALDITQTGLFIKHRRDCWPQVSANCPEMVVKQRILAHEYEEIVEDEYSAYGHLHLVVRQAASVGVAPEDVLSTVPLPTTRAVLYAYGWIMREKSWQEGLAALMATERTNDNRLLEDLQGGHSGRWANKWMAELGLDRDQVPHDVAHSTADEKHSDMFLPILAELVSPGQEAVVLQAIRESLDLRELMYKGITEAMERVA
jgi:pyrroloquinoline quinone (PQQ) biosynthesis protein C